MLRRLLGKQGEDFATNYLIKLGFKIRDKNVYFKSGEIDIVAEKDDSLYFFEVRTRNNPLVDPLETITETKRKKVWRSAENYILENNWQGNCQIGYIGIDKSKNPPLVECVFDYG